MSFMEGKNFFIILINIRSVSARKVRKELLLSLCALLLWPAYLK